MVSERSLSRVFPDLLWFAILALWAELWEQQGGKEKESAQIDQGEKKSHQHLTQTG